MPSKSIPNMFRILLSGMCISQSDIRKTSDNFFLVYKSLSDILAQRNVFDFLGSKGERLLCDRFFDDWFLYAVPSEVDYTYSLLKFREQEHDAEDGTPADGDTPGVTISFISFDADVLLRCMEAPTEYESAAILATHAGNTSIYSFAAEIEYHARFLTHLAKIKIPFFGRSIYDSAIRADMTVDDKEFEGPAPFYQETSKIVRRQYALHQEQTIISKEGALL